MGPMVIALETMVGPMGQGCEVCAGPHGQGWGLWWILWLGLWVLTVVQTHGSPYPFLWRPHRKPGPQGSGAHRNMV